MTDVQTRQPTVEEAVSWLMISKTQEYRRTSLAHWKTLYGGNFTEKVEWEVKRQWAKRKR